MSELSHRARAFVQEHRAALQPNVADRARVLERLLKRLEANREGSERVVTRSPNGLRQSAGRVATKSCATKS